MTISIEMGDLGEFLDLSLDLFCIIDLDGYFKLLNRAWEQFWSDPTGYGAWEQAAVTRLLSPAPSR